mgnify:CR=1 FL=1
MFNRSLKATMTTSTLFVVTSLACAWSVAGPDDKKLQSHYIVDDFESYQIGDYWPKVNAAKVVDDCGIGGSSNQCIRVTYEPNSKGSSRLTKKIDIPKSDHTILSYDIMFEDGWEFVRGGKLPGLAPEEPTSGCKPIAADSWSARPMWRANGQIQSYYYGQDRSTSCGQGEIGDSFSFEKGKWHNVEVNVKLNDEYNEYGGHVIIKVDGKIVAGDRNLRLRRKYSDDSLVSMFYFNTFFGGNDSSWAPSKTVTALYDNFEVRTVQAEQEMAQHTSEQIQAKTIAAPKKPEPPQLFSVQTLKEDGIEQMLSQNIDSLAAGQSSGAQWSSEWTTTEWVRGVDEGRVFVDSNESHNQAGNALRVHFPQGSQSRNDNGMQWQLKMPSFETSTCVSYWLKFDSQFEYGKGGKLPGVASVSGPADQNWKSYLAWKSDGKLVIDVADASGYRSLPLSFEAEQAKLKRDKWQSIQTCYGIDKAGIKEGFVEVWLDGERVGAVPGVRFARQAKESGPIDRILVNAYHESSPSDPIRTDAYAWFDELAVTRTPLVMK